MALTCIREYFPVDFLHPVSLSIRDEAVKNCSDVRKRGWTNLKGLAQSLQSIGLRRSWEAADLNRGLNGAHGAPHFVDFGLILVTGRSSAKRNRRRRDSMHSSYKISSDRESAAFLGIMDRIDSRRHALTVRSIWSLSRRPARKKLMQ